MPGELLVVALVCLAWAALEADARIAVKRRPSTRSTIVLPPRGIAWQPWPTYTCLFCKRERRLEELKPFECLTFDGHVCAGGCPQERQS